MFLNIPIFLYFVLGATILYLLLESRRKRKNYPPGPWRLPVLGNLLSIGDKIHLAFTLYAQIYGPIFSVKLGDEEVVVLHGAELIREAFKNPIFDGRPIKEAAETFILGGRDGILLGSGQSWIDNRRFALRHLRDFGVGKSSIEDIIMPEVQELVEWITEQNGKPISLHRRFSLAVINILWRTLSGNRYDHDNRRLIGILEQLETTGHALFAGKGKSLVRFFFPKIAKMFPNWSGWKFLLKSLEPRTKLFDETITEHERTLQAGQPRDFIDVFLLESKNTQDTNSIFHKSRAREALHSVMADFFLAGSHTSSVTLTWSILYLMHYKDVQVKIQNEIDRVVGKSRAPNLADRNSLPFTVAFIMEVMRITSIASYGVPHAVLEDVEFHGFKIPKGTSVYPSLYSTHHDPEVWGDPENFRPERFLTEDGSKVQQHESLIPFSVGRRSCIGETLGRDQVFLFVANLVQRFHVLSEPRKPMPTLDILLGQVVLDPHPYVVVMKNRS